MRFTVTLNLSHGANVLSGVAIAAIVLMLGDIAQGDGGSLQISKRCGNLQISVFTSPAAPRVGPVDVSVLVQDATTKRIRDDVNITVRMECTNAPAIPLAETATHQMATNQLFRAAQFDVPTAGTWRVAPTLSNSNNSCSLAFDLVVAPPMPAWLQLAPWVGWPFAVVLLFGIHQFLASRRRTGGRTPTDA